MIAQAPIKEKQLNSLEGFLKIRIGGVAFTLVIATFGYAVSRLPGPDHIGQLGCAILLAIVFRQLWGYPEKQRAGIQYSSRTLLRLAIVLYGLKLNMIVVFQQGLGLLAIDAMMITAAVTLTLLLAKLLKADMSLSLLLGAGTGICGAAAIAAISPIVRAKEKETAIGAGMIALVGTLFAIGYTLLMPYLGLTAEQYGIWSGVSLHEIAHVALAAAPAGEDPLAIALLAKLGRVFLLVPFSLLLLVWMKRKDSIKARNGAGQANERAKVEFPWFLLGFMAMSFVGSFVLGKYIVLPESVMNSVATVTTFLLTMAMVGLGLNVSLKELNGATLRALSAMIIVSIVLSVATGYVIAQLW